MNARKRSRSGDEAQLLDGGDAQKLLGPSQLAPAPRIMNAPERLSEDEDHWEDVLFKVQNAAIPSSLNSGSGGSAPPPRVAPPAFGPSPLDPTIAEIIAAHRERCFWMEKRKRDNNALGAYIRTSLGWSLAKPKAERDAIKRRAGELIALAERYVRDVAKAKAKPPEMPAELGQFAGIAVATITMRATTDVAEAAHTKRMADLAASLPAYSFVSSQKGLGALGLAIIVAEAGTDLCNFANKGRLYKRLDLAVIDGVRQGGLSKTAPKEKWIEHGYSPQRRSRIWTIATSALMAGNERYKQIYLDRKAYEVAIAEARGLTVAPSNKIPEKRRAEFISVGHIHARARRYAEKKMICDIWRAWRKDTNSGVAQASVG